jgi:hypothetical protein
MIYWPYCCTPWQERMREEAHLPHDWMQKREKEVGFQDPL